MTDVVNQAGFPQAPSSLADLSAPLKKQNGIPFDPELPVVAFNTEIIKAVLKNDVTIVIAETGAGKSTVIPWSLYALAGQKTIVTEPRRVAAQALAGFVAQQDESELGENIGVKTAIHNNASSTTKLLFATDGWVLAKILGNTKRGPRVADVLVLDEIHEENKNLSLLIGLMRKWKSEGVDVPKLLLMSATVAKDKLLKIFPDAALFEIPGRSYPVEKRWEPTAAIEDMIAEQVAAGKDTMVFLPGKYEIEEMHSKLRMMKLDAEILPLHGEVERPQQRKVFHKYERPKIILSTDIGQTSITPDVDTVIACGIKRRVKLFDGIERLCDVDCSLFDLIQQAGRAGRTKPGLFILCSEKPFVLSKDLAPKVFDRIKMYTGPRREQKEVAQIHTTRIDKVCLLLIAAGVDLRYLNPYLPEPISRERIQETMKRLLRFKAITPDGGITETGRQLLKYPGEIETAEIIRRSKDEVLGICIGALLEVGGVLEFERNVPAEKQAWKPYFGNEQKSELVGQLNVFLAVLSKVITQYPELRGLELRHAIEDHGKQMGLKKRKVALFFDTVEMLGKYKKASGAEASWVFDELIARVSKQPEYRVAGSERDNTNYAIACGLREFIFLPVDNSKNKKLLVRIAGKDASDNELHYEIRPANPITPKPQDVVFGVPFQLERDELKAMISGSLCLSRKELSNIPDVVVPEVPRTKAPKRGNGRNQGRRGAAWNRQMARRQMERRQMEQRQMEQRKSKSKSKSKRLRIEDRPKGK
jgi:HrpA-like RNA helicase